MAYAGVSDRIRDWLERALTEGGHTQTELARAIGVAPSAVSRVLKGERSLGIKELLDALNFLGRSDEILDVLALDDAVKKKLMLQADADQSRINALAAEEAARKALPGIAMLGSTTVAVRPFEAGMAEWVVPLTSIGGSEEEDLRWLVVNDDSMVPTLHRSDIVFIDRSRRSPTKPGIYAIEDGFGEPIVRRLQMNDFPASPSSKVVVSTDDERYQKHLVALDGLRIIGACIGIYSPILF